MAGLKLEIAQSLPFSSLEEEAILNLIRTTDRLQRAFQLRIRGYGITSTQYNVLRILRGAQPHGLSCSAIGDRMIAAEPDVTRVVARLKAIKLVRQHRDTEDRRVLWTTISARGLELLARMDPLVENTPKELLGHLQPAELHEFIRLLELARSEESASSVSCSGNHTTNS